MKTKEKVIKWIIEKAITILVSLFDKYGQKYVDEFMFPIYTKIDKKMDKEIGVKESNQVKDTIAEIFESQAELLRKDGLRINNNFKFTKE